MSTWRISMHTQSEQVNYVNFDWYVNYKPTKWEFNIYLSETKESKDLKTIGWALITRRNVVLAQSKWDKPVTSQDFDSFDEKLYFRETVKWWSVIAKDLTYSEAKNKANDLFFTSSFRLASCYYLVTEKWAVLKLILTWTTRTKVNEILDNMKDIDFLTFTVWDKVTVWSWSRSKEVYELKVEQSTKEYTRVAVDKINWTVQTLQKILESKKWWTKIDEWVSVNEAEEVFDNTDTDDLPI